MKIVRTQEEVDALMNKCYLAEDDGESKYPGMSYEQGLKDAIEWLTGDMEENPLED